MTKSRIALSAVLMLFGAVSVQADSTFGYFTLNMVRPNKADLVLRQYNAFTPLCYSGVPVQWPAVDPTARRFPRLGFGVGPAMGCNTCGNSQFTIPGAEGEVLSEGEIMDGSVRPTTKIRNLLGR